MMMTNVTAAADAPDDDSWMNNESWLDMLEWWLMMMGLKIHWRNDDASANT